MCFGWEMGQGEQQQQQHLADGLEVLGVLVAVLAEDVDGPVAVGVGSAHLPRPRRPLAQAVDALGAAAQKGGLSGGDSCYGLPGEIGLVGPCSTVECRIADWTAAVWAGRELQSNPMPLSAQCDAQLSQGAIHGI